VLVFGPGHVVATVHISPVNILGQQVNGEGSLCPGAGGLLDGAILEGGLGNTAALRLVHEEFIIIGGRVLRLRESVNSLVVGGRILLLFGGMMLNTDGPGVQGNGPGAVALNAEVINASNDLEETLLTPMGAPGVTNTPVLDTVLNTKTNN